MTISVPGYGAFEIANEKAEELVSWLRLNSVKVDESTKPTGYDGIQLING